MNANRRLALLIFFTLSLPAVINAQITWSGIYDFEIRKGGKGSSLESNELPNDRLQLNVHNLQIFFDAALESGISFSGKIASSKSTAPDIRGIDVELAYVTFSGLVDNALSISAGKILTPFGAFTRRQLSPDNPLPGNPMFYYYRTNVSAASGYLDSSGVLLAQSLYGGRLSTIYSGGYYVGVEIFGSFADDLLQYDVAVMNAPLSSQNSGLNLDKQLSYQGRIGIHPAIWGTFGVSYSTGSYLERGTVNSFLDSTGGTERFKQETVGFDVNLNYLFYELNAEYIINRFSAPYIVYDFTVTPPYRSGLSGTDELRLSGDELLIDVKIDAPFSPGLYLAGRFNTSVFGKIKDPSSNSTTFGKEVSWDRDVQRYAIALGYKPARGILIKIGYEWTKVDVSPRPDLDVFATQLSVSF